MGLAERRAAEAFRTDEYPGWKRKLDTAAGFDLPVEVRWEELTVEGYGDSYPQFFAKVYFEPLVNALAAVAVDDMGKEALAGGLTKVVLRNSGGYHNSAGLSLIGGVLTFDHRPDANVDYGEERAKQLQQLLESKL